jgi:hypothetical protein
MDFREYEVINEGRELVIVGTIRDPVTWEFSIRLCQDDISGMAKLILCGRVIRFVLSTLFKRKSTVDHHWTDEYSEHLAKGKEFSIDAKQKATDRVAAYKEAKAKEAEEAAAAMAAEVVAAGSVAGKA